MPRESLDARGSEPRRQIGRFALPPDDYNDISGLSFHQSSRVHGFKMADNMILATEISRDLEFSFSLCAGLRSAPHSSVARNPPHALYQCTEVPNYLPATFHRAGVLATRTSDHLAVAGYHPSQDQ